MRPSMRLASCVAEPGAAIKLASTPWRANSPFSCATKIGQLELPEKPITRSGCPSAGEATSATSAPSKKPLRLIVPYSGTAVSHMKRWAIIPKEEDDDGNLRQAAAALRARCVRRRRGRGGFPRQPRDLPLPGRRPRGAAGRAREAGRTGGAVQHHDRATPQSHVSR